jgi:prophage regulatory protein
MPTEPPVRLLTYREVIEAKRVPYTRRHIERLVDGKLFPAPVQVGPGRLAFIEAEIDAWIARRVAQRDTKAA